MHRLFVALLPPDPLAEALLAGMGGVDGARWQTRQQLHLTLAFAGEVDRHAANRIAEALAAVRAGPLLLRSTGPGLFEGRRPGRVAALWVGIAGTGLEPLANRVRQACRVAGVHPDARRFVGHVTCARCPGAGVPVEAARPFMERPLLLPEWRADRFWLMESRLGRGGAHYQPIADYPLPG